MKEHKASTSVTAESLLTRIQNKMDKDGHTLRRDVREKDPKACQYTVLDGAGSKVASGTLADVADSLGLIYEGEEVVL